MSAEVFRKNQIRTLLTASKNYTSTKFSTFNSNMEDMFRQVDAALVSLTARVAALENTIENLPEVVNFIENSRLFIDADGDLAQDDIQEEE